MTVKDEQIWQSLGNDLRSFFRRRLSDAALAEDLAQESLLRVYQGLPALRDETRLRPWVFRIARNVLTDHYRSRRPGTEAVPEELPAAGPEPENLDGEVGGWLQWMIGLLPEDYREAVRLTEVDGLTAPEIAGRMGISLPAAKSRVQRGREKLRNALFACCDVEFDRRGHAIGYTQKGNECEGCGS